MALNLDESARCRDVRTAETDAVVTGLKTAALIGEAAAKRVGGVTRVCTRAVALVPTKPATERLIAERRAMPARLVDVMVIREEPTGRRGLICLET
tara:strand:- start:16483 stop:16770 length:288 start_codon:yes stop_codon:yes gene_type:complete